MFKKTEQYLDWNSDRILFGIPEEFCSELRNDFDRNPNRILFGVCFVRNSEQNPPTRTLSLSELRPESLRNSDRILLGVPTRF